MLEVSSIEMHLAYGLRIVQQGSCISIQGSSGLHMVPVEAKDGRSERVAAACGSWRHLESDMALSHKQICWCGN